MSDELSKLRTFVRDSRSEMIALETLLTKKYGGSTVSDELGLPVTESGLILPCGASGRWTAN